MLSYWEKQSFFEYDLVIIGGGLVGLSTAISYRELHPTERILVLERGLLPYGASTKNAGFACIGSLTELLADLSEMPTDQMLALVKLRFDGLKKLKARLGEKNIGYAENGSYELLSEKEISALDNIDKMNSLLMPLLNREAFSVSSEKIKSLGFSNEIKCLVKNNFEGELHTGKMFTALYRQCLQHTIEIKTGAEVEAVHEEEKFSVIEVKNYLTKDILHFHARKVCLCTNAFSKKFLPNDVDLKPGRGQVLITKPIKGLAFKGIYHFDCGYYYFREIDGRVLFGGGRNIDFETETSEEFCSNEFILSDLKQKLKDVILPQYEFEIDFHWVGIMAFGKNKFPFLEKIGHRTVACVRMGGMGVAIGSALGERAAVLLSTIDN